MGKIGESDHYMHRTLMGEEKYKGSNQKITPKMTGIIVSFLCYYVNIVQ